MGNPGHSPRIKRSMKICPKCSEQHTKPGTFCSRTCANSREWSDESNRLRSSTAKSTASQRSPDQRQEMTRKAVAKVVELADHRRLVTPTEEFGHDGRRRKVIEEQNNSCLSCGLNEWLGEKLTLELDHIDGDNTNNVRANLRALCPNCHSQTPTWRGKMRLSSNGRTLP